MPAKPAKPAGPSRPVAYSYLRFSSAEQAKGDSVRRQEELRDAWIRKNGAMLDTSLHLRDEGVSAYTGAHRENPDRNALAAFLELVKRGSVPRGSALIVESLDRLSREDIRPALSLLLQLIDAGVRIVQLLPTEAVYDEKVEPMALMMAIMELSRGHSESRMKSERIGRSWANRKRKAREGELLATRNVPGWLKVSGGKIVTVPARVAVVRRIFRAAARGDSIVTICRALNTEGVPPFGRADQWNPSSVQKILRGREPLGEFQPGRLAMVERTRGGRAVKAKVRVKDGDPVKDYYPRVISDDEWWAAQGGLTDRQTGHGRPAHNFWNPFAGKLRDARDRAPLYLLHHGKRRAAAFVSKRPLKGHREAGGYVSFPAEPLIAEVLGRIREINVKEVVGDVGSNEEEVLRLTAQRADTAARIAALRAALEGDDAVITPGGAGGASVNPKDVRSAVASLGRLEEKERELAEALAQAKAKSLNPVTAAWADAQTLIGALATARDPDDVRARIRSAVRRVVSDVWCVFHAYPSRERSAAVQVNFEGGVRRHYVLYHRPAVKNQWGADRPAKTYCESFAAVAGEGDIDLRKPADVKKVERLLAGLDFSAKS